jgi:DNA-binding IclR family transcriptional regulator
MRLTGFSDSNINRYLKLLMDNELVEFRGNSTLTGRYFLTPAAKKILK